MNHDLSDNDIFQTLREGSEEAFGTLFRRYYPRLHRFACKYIADEASASDAVQTCFMRLWERRSTLVGGSLQSMLYTMLRNECLNSLKHTAIVEGYARQAQSVADTEPLYTPTFWVLPTISCSTTNCNSALTVPSTRCHSAQPTSSACRATNRSRTAR